MKKILLFQVFDCKDQARALEFDQCVRHNLELGFDEIIIFNDNVPPRYFGKNIRNIEVDKRLTYKDFIELAQSPKNYGNFLVLINTDIKLDKKMFELERILGEKTLIALARYEVGDRLADMPWCTQDVWVLVGQPIPKSILFQSDIPLGVPGCELRFSELMFNVGFQVFNPCMDIKNLHVHKNQVPHSDENRVFGAYLFTPACGLNDVFNKSANAWPIPHYLTSFVPKLFTMQECKD
ncbi:hypothetical protein A8O14_00710 [Polynucleobacter wuianus]|uniref:Glycosyltransferase 2-like domain-containing protein n=1 Tax=Polynucleobacter wuianus TaxID=1743168 RepID=A0A191UCI3_9BURK|nr:MULTISPECIES: hypothetical protein [Polynucleobacter]ANI98748.1 hypothetical protein A8O14_00710 [Polynucleobacter wuianus]MBU3553311.1 hypothetical protein [Polynucleobacter sp. MWH-Post4-6-1]